jgi:AraC family transcriptional regulator, transcriptional activator of the genes for pyochelin and ferripyochelin receptors
MHTVPFSSPESGLSYRYLTRLELKGNTVEAEFFPNDILVVNSLKCGVNVNSGYNQSDYEIAEGESLTLFYPMGNWKAQLEFSDSKTEVLLLRIDVLKLHRFLTGETNAGYREVMESGYFPGGKGKTAEVLGLPPQARLALRQILEPPVGIASVKAWIRAKITEFFVLLMEGNKQKKTDSKCPFMQHGELFEQMKLFRSELIRSMDDAVISDFAEKSGVSVHALRAGFKKTFGKTVREFCQEVRLDRAMELMQTTDKNVSEVAYEIGYSNPSHFIAAFKKRFGDTPASFSGKKLDIKAV